MRDGHPRRGLVGHLGHVGALHAVLRVVQRVQVTGRQRRDGLGADHHAGLLDDVEHLRNALVHLADQPALGGHAVLAQRQLAGGRDLQAHLVLDVGDVHAVALAELAGLEVEEELRHEEQRQTLGARACALGAGQHQVEDVLEQVAGVTRGDEALHTVDVPGAVVLLDGLGPAGADVGTGVGLGEHHGGAPAALGGDARPTSSAPRCPGGRGCWRIRRRRRTSTRRGWRRGCARAAPTSAPWASARRRAPRRGRPCPSRPSSTARTDFLNASGSVTECVFGSKVGGLRSRVGERLGDRPLGQPGHLAQHLAGGVDV